MNVCYHGFTNNKQTDNIFYIDIDSTNKQTNKQMIN